MNGEIIKQFSKDFVNNAKSGRLDEETLITDGLYEDEILQLIGEDSEPCFECDESEDDIDSELDDILSEVGSSTIRMTKKRKIRMLTGLSSVRIAKKKNDPLYRKYQKHRAIALKLKKKLTKKYKSRGKRVAKRALR